MPPIPPCPIMVAVLDDYQDISAAHFEYLKPTFQFTAFEHTLPPYDHPCTSESAKNELVERLRPYTVISSMRERTAFPEVLLKQLPNLKLLLTTGTRNRSIDMVAAQTLGIKVTGALGSGGPNAPSLTGKKRKGPDSTTQHTVALVLGIARNIAHDHAVVKAGGWQTGVATGLSGKTFASLGLGKLGVSVAKIMHVAFGMKVVAWSSSLTQDVADEKAEAAGLPTEDDDGEKTFKVVSKEELFRIADVLSVHYVLSERSRGLVGLEDLKLMKKSALFVNTSRGPIVDENALIEVLNEGRLRGAAIDVFDIEPLPKDNEWRTTKWGEDGRSHVLLTPHMGYVEEETMNNWYDEQAENLERWFQGKELLNVLA
ncbi:putative glyoxylate reductase [Venustampulla echinocandica]|uniref:Putative glyoxylate reductase n=1 Tax=Venustampulla echinocandica TaxID=2656787 RepID=A0A370U3L4_9HELO|nr:putative glyoxylate reductase [Venustampulla echinocandica]RDL42371.1 putative glyoxylate reductase [Venustampulla echinocandica]